jgi:polysaccharide biosynthesis transport protein
VNNYEVPVAVSSEREVLYRAHGRHHSFHASGLRSLLHLAYRRMGWIIASLFACALVALVITVRTKPIYESTATIELNKSGGGSLDLGIADLSQQLGTGADSLLTDQQTETAILQGDSLALSVIEKLGLASQPQFTSKASQEAEAGLPLEEAPNTRTRLLGIFKSNLKVNPIRGTRLIQVSYDSTSPRQAAEIANALIDGYRNQYLQTHYEAVSQTSDWLAKQLSALKENVEESEKKLTDFEKENDILNLSVGSTGSEGSSSREGQVHSVTIAKLDALNAELTQAEANRIEKEAIYHLVQSNNGGVIVGLASDPLAAESNSMVLNQGGGVSNLQQLRRQQNELKMNLAEVSTTYGAKNRHLQEIETQLGTIDQQIHQEMQEIIKRARADFELAERTEDEIGKRFKEQQAAASRLNEKAVQFAVLSQEAYSRKKLYEDLYTKLQEANVSAGLKATNITVVDPARSQSVPVRPKRLTNLTLGVFLGLLIGVSSAYAADSLDKTVGSPAEVEEITGRPVVGAIASFGEKDSVYGMKVPKLPKSRRSNAYPAFEADPASMPIWMLEHPNSPPAEGFRTLRTAILLSGRERKTILVTGCTPGEGKTTVTTNLAVAFAQHGKRVIVIEADMRRPKLKHKLDFSEEHGLSNVLAGTCSADEAILRGRYVPSLDILPAGPRPPFPSEMLGSTAFDELLHNFRKLYDVILIDSPPALLVTDAVSISQKVEAVLWVAHAGVVTRPYLERAAQLIDRNNMPIIGFVLNRISRKTAGYGYDYEMYSSYYSEAPENEV